MKKLILLSVLVLIGLGSSGCIGLVVVHPREKCTTRFCLGTRGELTNGVVAVALTQTDVLARWGQPNSCQTNAETRTVWHYVGERNWTFVVPAYMIGLPLPFPSGRNYVDIYFKDGTAQEVRSCVTVVTGAMIGAYPPLIVLAAEKEPNTTFDGALVGYGFSNAP